MSLSGRPVILHEPVRVKNRLNSTGLGRHCTGQGRVWGVGGGGGVNSYQLILLQIVIKLRWHFGTFLSSPERKKEI